MKISNTKLDLYETCGRKFKYRYIENLKGNFTATPLLYGTAIDNALNYILQSIKDKKEWSKEEAEELFLTVMRTWEGQNRLDFFKNEVPEELKESYDEQDPETWEIVWDLMCKRGLASLTVYINDVLPQLDEILSIQNPIEVTNEEGDTFVGFVDFIAKLKDGRVVLFDNKTASSKYPKNKVVTSQQLSLYLDQFPSIEYAGYIVLIKNPAREKGLTFQFMVDQIPEEVKADAYSRLEKALEGIKAERFEPNYKSCKKFGKPCEYIRYCQYGIKDDLIPAYDKKK